MSETESSVRQTKLLKQKEYFGSSESLEEAFFMVDRGIDGHGRFIHYTTLNRLVQIVTSKQWWLTRADSDSLNDTQEAKKYGNIELLKCMYQASFSYGCAENAAMWGLYCPGNPFGVMISIDGKAMREWFSRIRNKKLKICLEYDRATAKHAKHFALVKKQIDLADARDVIYASTGFSNAGSKGKNRSDTLCWFGMRTKPITNLNQEINLNEFTGWIKDGEWVQENESRIAVRVKNIPWRLPPYLSISVPDSVLKSMRVTLGPWLNDEYYGEVSNVVCSLFAKLHNGKLPNNMVARSVITGALESWRDRYRGGSNE